MLYVSDRAISVKEESRIINMLNTRREKPKGTTGDNSSEWDIESEVL